MILGYDATRHFLQIRNTKVTADEVLRSHVEQTLNRIADPSEALVTHDSSTVSVTSEGHREGLTPNRGEKQSFLLHCSLALRADGTRRPEGVLGASYHVPTEGYRLRRDVEG